MQPMDSPGSRRATCRYRTVSESSEPLNGRLGPNGHSEGSAYKPLDGEVALCQGVGRMGSIKR
jgi:hypothetical protein